LGAVFFELIQEVGDDARFLKTPIDRLDDFEEISSLVVRRHHFLDVVKLTFDADETPIMSRLCEGLLLVTAASPS
jgi:hypothetical protein